MRAPFCIELYDDVLLYLTCTDSCLGSEIYFVYFLDVLAAIVIVGVDESYKEKEKIYVFHSYIIIYFFERVKFKIKFYKVGVFYLIHLGVFLFLLINIYIKLFKIKT